MVKGVRVKRNVIRYSLIVYSERRGCHRIDKSGRNDPLLIWMGLLHSPARRLAGSFAMAALNE